MAAWPPPLRSPPPSRTVRDIGLPGFSGVTGPDDADEPPGAPQAVTDTAAATANAATTAYRRCLPGLPTPRCVMSFLPGTHRRGHEDTRPRLDGRPGGKWRAVSYR